MDKEKYYGDDDHVEGDDGDDKDAGDDGDGDEVAVVKCETTAGDFTMEFYQEWSPIGYMRAVELFDRGFYDGSHFFRVLPGFLTQFGIGYTKDKALQKLADETIPDDPQLVPKIEFKEGIISFAGSGKNSRTSHLFIAYDAVPSLGRELWETPVGKVVEGMETIRGLNAEYKEDAEQWRIKQGGKEYMEKNFPNMDRFLKCTASAKEEEGLEKYYGEVKPDKEMDEETDKKHVVYTMQKQSIRGRAKNAEKKVVSRIPFKKDDGTLDYPIIGALVLAVIVLCMFSTGRKRKAAGKTS